jgi:hypothetical protein
VLSFFSAEPFPLLTASVTHLPKLEHLHVMGTCLQLLDLGLLGSLVLQGGGGKMCTCRTQNMSL